MTPGTWAGGSAEDDGVLMLAAMSAVTGRAGWDVADKEKEVGALTLEVTPVDCCPDCEAGGGEIELGTLVLGATPTAAFSEGKVTDPGRETPVLEETDTEEVATDAGVAPLPAMVESAGGNGGIV